MTGKKLLHGLILTALFVLPAAVLLPHLGAFAFQPGAAFSDMAVTHYPNTLYLQRSLGLDRTVPLWSPLILSGYPFAANPLSGLYYPPGWLALLFPLPFGLNLMVALHLVWAGCGMYRFLRAEGLDGRAALFGALAFASLPKLISHHGAGHLTLIYAVCWTPWLLDADRRWLGRTWLRVVIPGVVLGMIVLADPRWAAYAGLLLASYRLFGWATGLRDQPAPRSISPKEFIAPVLSLTGTLIFAILIAAPLVLPMMQYTGLSTRSLLTTDDRLTLSLPLGNLFNLLFPALGGSAEWTLYPGAVTLALALLALGWGSVRRQAGLWLALILVSLVWALGSNIPGLEQIAALPGFDLLRVPPRALFLTGFCFAAAAAHALHGLLTLPRLRDRSGLLLFAVTAFAVLFAVAVFFVVPDTKTRVQFAWGALFLLLAAGCIFLARAGRMAPSVLAAALIVLSMADLIGVNSLAAEYRSPVIVLDPGVEIAAYLRSRSDGEPFRVYSPSYSIPQQVAALYSLELADGVDPLQLAEYAEFMAPATGVPVEGYSVTMPPFPTGSTAVDNQGFTPDAFLLGLLNVRYVVSEFELPGSGLQLHARIGGTRIYENPEAMPRAWVQPVDAFPGGGRTTPATINKQPNQIVVKASGPGLLVLSEIAYPGWRVTVDDAPAQMEVIGQLLRGVRLPDGEHTVLFTFRPMPLYTGLGLCILALLALLVTLILQGRAFRAGRE